MDTLATINDLKLVKAIRGLPRSSKTIALAVLIGVAFYSKQREVAKSSKKTGQASGHDAKASGAPRVSFSERLSKILHILLNGRDRSTILVTLGGLTTFLVLRTLLSIQVAITTGQVAQYLVQQKWSEFLRHVAKFAAIGVPAAVVNSGLKYCTNMLSLRFRRELTHHINKQYIVGVNFYKANQLPSTKIENVDQRVTADVEAFCEQLSNLYTSIFKPVLDIVLNTMKLSSMMGLKAPVLLFSYYMVVAQLKMAILRVLDLKGNTQVQSKLQGDYRTAHNRLIIYSEEIAFFEGSLREQGIISALFDRLFAHTAYVHKLHGMVGVLDQYVSKYGASLTGYALLCLPVFFPKIKGERSVADLTRDYVLNRQLLMDLASGIGVLLSTTTKIATFVGITARVSEVLERVAMLKEHREDNFALRENEEIPKEEAVAVVTDEWLEDWRVRGETLRQTGKRAMANRLRGSASSVALAQQQAAGAMEMELKQPEDFATPGVGKVVTGEIIKCKDVAIVSPDGRLLVRGLNIEVPHGHNVMITGPNGCGKSSMFRVLGELWPPYRGLVTTPPKEDIVFVPQKPYLVMGTLRDQIIYPQTVKEMEALNITDDDLTTLLDVVDPARSITKEWRYDDVRDWSSAFSGGQKQRIAMARVFYHRPRYAILDECTSAVSSEVEGKIYLTCKKLGITLFTVSHRPNLQQYHEYQLRFDGHGNWKYLTRQEVERETTKA